MLVLVTIFLPSTVNAQIDKPLQEASGTLSVISTLPNGTSCDGDVFVDEEPVGTTPWRGQISASKHRVRVKCGNDSGVADVVLSENGHESLTLATAPLGRVTVEASYEDGTKCDKGIVRLMDSKVTGGDEWGTLPFDGWLPSGPYTVRVDCADGSGDREIVLRTNRHEQISVGVEGRPVVSAWPWVTFTLGALTLAGGGVLNYFGNQDLDAVANAERDDFGVIIGMSLSEAQKLEREGNLMNDSSIAMYAVGGAAMLSGLIAGIVDVVQTNKTRGKSRQRSLNPSGFFVPGGAGVGIVGGF